MTHLCKPHVILRPRENGDFDELVGHGCYVHFEMMHDGCLWCAVEVDEPEGRRKYALWINAMKGKKLLIHCDDEGIIPAK
jgi:hypothetical protein